MNDTLLETNLSFDDDIPIFHSSFEDMIEEYNAITPEQLLDFATSSMKKKLMTLKDRNNDVDA